MRGTLKITRKGKLKFPSVVHVAFSGEQFVEHNLALDYFRLYLWECEATLHFLFSLTPQSLGSKRVFFFFVLVWGFFCFFFL